MKGRKPRWWSNGGMRESILGSPCASLHRVETSLRTSTSNWWRPEEEHSHPRESRLYTVRARGRLPLGSKYDLVQRTSRKGTRFENQTLDLSGILSCGFRVRFIVDRKQIHTDSCVARARKSYDSNACVRASENVKKQQSDY